MNWAFPSVLPCALSRACGGGSSRRRWIHSDGAYSVFCMLDNHECNTHWAASETRRGSTARGFIGGGGYCMLYQGFAGTTAAQARRTRSRGRQQHYCAPVRRDSVSEVEPKEAVWQIDSTVLAHLRRRAGAAARPPSMATSRRAATACAGHRGTRRRSCHRCPAAAGQTRWVGNGWSDTSITHHALAKSSTSIFYFRFVFEYMYCFDGSPKALWSGFQQTIPRDAK
jgi:hypothetical protein